MQRGEELEQRGDIPVHSKHSKMEVIYPLPQLKDQAEDNCQGVPELSIRERVRGLVFSVPKLAGRWFCHSRLGGGQSWSW